MRAQSAPLTPDHPRPAGDRSRSARPPGSGSAVVRLLPSHDEVSEQVDAASASGPDRSPSADACVISVDHCPQRRIVLISMWGTVGSDALEDLSEAVEEAVSAHPLWVLIDLSTARLDPDGLALLHLTRRKLARHHVQLAVTGISRRVRNALDRIGQSLRCPFYTSVDVAIAAIEESAASAPLSSLQ